MESGYVRKNIEPVKMPKGMKEGMDFILLSKIATLDDFEMVPYIEGMDESNVKFVNKTPYDDRYFDYVYDITDQDEVDFKLAITIGLGVIQDGEGNQLLYNISVEEDLEERLKEEHLRLGMYYQITHPEYDDRKLHYLLNSNGGEHFLRGYFLDSPFPPDGYEPS